MAPTQKSQVVEARLAAVGPVLNVVRFAPGGRRSTAVIGAAAVARDERIPQSLRHGTGRPTDIEDLAASLREHAVHTTVTGEPPQRLRADRTEMIEITAHPIRDVSMSVSAEYFEIDVDAGAIRGAPARRNRTVAMLQERPHDVAQRVFTTLCPRAARITRRIGVVGHARFERTAQQFGRL